MANITVEQIQVYADTLKNWLQENESPAKECLVIQFEKASSTEIDIDEDQANQILYVQVNQTLYLDSRNGNVAIDFDRSGQIVNIEIS